MVFRGLSSWLRSGEMSSKLYNELVGFVASYVNSKKVDSRKFGVSRQELVYEIVHSFVLKMPKLRTEILQRSKTPEGYFVSSLRNFVVDYLSSGPDHTLSLDFEFDNGSNLLETLISEEWSERLNADSEHEELEDARTELAEKLNLSNGTVLRNLRVFVLTELAEDCDRPKVEELERLSGDQQDWCVEFSPSNVYKMRQRAKEFLRSFARENSYSGRAVVRATLEYLKLHAVEARVPGSVANKRKLCYCKDGFSKPHS